MKHPRWQLDQENSTDYCCWKITSLWSADRSCMSAHTATSYILFQPVENMSRLCWFLSCIIRAIITDIIFWSSEWIWFWTQVIDHTVTKYLGDRSTDPETALDDPPQRRVFSEKRDRHRLFHGVSMHGQLTGNHAFSYLQLGVHSHTLCLFNHRSGIPPYSDLPSACQAEPTTDSSSPHRKNLSETYFCQNIAFRCPFDPGSGTSLRSDPLTTVGPKPLQIRVSCIGKPLRSVFGVFCAIRIAAQSFSSIQLDAVIWRVRCIVRPPVGLGWNFIGWKVVVHLLSDARILRGKFGRI